MSDRNGTPQQHPDHELREGLQGLNIPAPDDDARRAAITAAMRAFDDVQSEKAPARSRIVQGFLAWLRPTKRDSADARNKGMFTAPRVWLWGGGAAACLGVIAVGLVLQNQPGQWGDPLGTQRERGVVDSIRDALVGKDESQYAKLPGPAEGVDASQYAEQSLKARPGSKQAEREDTDEIAETGSGFEFFSVLRQAEPTAIADQIAPSPGYSETGRDRFGAFSDNPIKLVAEAPVSTFSIDVDTASYSFVRSELNRGVLPQPDAVRAEEMINYFDYAYPAPASPLQPFTTTVAVTDSPWAEGRRLLHIGIKGYELPASSAPRSNLVFLLDVSGSMNSPDKLPLVKQSMQLLLSRLGPDDTVSIAVYAGAAGTVLEPTPVRERRKIVAALDRLSAGGSTAGGEGLRLAYQLAEDSFDEDAVNRVILATDGDFNVGIRSDSELRGFIERKRDAGIYLSVLGFGRGNYQDELMQTMAQHGNGIAAYIDTLGEAQKVLVTEATSSLIPIAGDVKIQVEFNPATVSEYRLIGYETRRLNREDLNNDRVDAGDIGAGHTVTAIYEVTPVGSPARQIDPRRYGPKADAPEGAGGDYAFLKLRYKLPGEKRSRLIERAIHPETDSAERLPAPLRRELDFASSVAGFAQLLRGGRHTGDFGYDDVIELAQANKGPDPYGYRTEFTQLVRKAVVASVLSR